MDISTNAKTTSQYFLNFHPIKPTSSIFKRILDEQLGTIHIFN